MDINKIIEDNMGLVYKQLHRFNRAYDPDAFSYALEALSNAAATYDSSKNVSFSTYASVCIYNILAWYLREEARHNKLQVVSLEEPSTEFEGVRLVDTIASPDTVESDFLKQELYDKLWQAFDVVYGKLKNDVSRRIIDEWRKSDFMIRQAEISKVVGASQAHVSRVISAFKHKLKLEMEDYLCEK